MPSDDDARVVAPLDALCREVGAGLELSSFLVARTRPWTRLPERKLSVTVCAVSLDCMRP